MKTIPILVALALSITARADIPSYSSSRTFVEAHSPASDIPGKDRVFLLKIRHDRNEVNILRYSDGITLKDLAKYTLHKNAEFTVLVMRSKDFLQFVRSSSPEIDTFKIHPLDVIQFYDGVPILF